MLTIVFAIAIFFIVEVFAVAAVTISAALIVDFAWLQRSDAVGKVTGREVGNFGEHSGLRMDPEDLARYKNKVSRRIEGHVERSCFNASEGRAWHEREPAMLSFALHADS